MKISFWFKAYATALGLLTAAIAPSPAQPARNSPTATPPAVAATVFQMPQMRRQQIAAIRYIQAGQFQRAEKTIKQTIQQFPKPASNYYVLATILAKKGSNTEALHNLEIAIQRGYRGSANIDRDPNFSRLWNNEKFKNLARRGKLAALDPKPQNRKNFAPAVPNKGQAVVAVQNTRWNERLNTLETYFRFDTVKPISRSVNEQKTAVAAKLNQWFNQGIASGNHGDLYDNRDRGHSLLRRQSLVQFTKVIYSGAAKRSGLDYGLNTGLFFNGIVIGNSSTAAGRGRISLPRVAMTSSFLTAITYLQYINNHLYVFPEVVDHDPGKGDVYPANTPYVIISQGASSSDRPFLNAAGSILAAYRPEVKKHLRETKLTMPTLQMVFRRGQKAVKNDADYLSGKAHPTVFRAEDMDLMKSIILANSLKIADIPPMVELSVIQEKKAVLGVDYFSPGLTETLFDSPSAIARVIRSKSFEKRMLVSAAKTKTPEGQILTYHWAVLRGDEKRIQIKKRNEKGTVAELIIPWHDRRPIPERPELTTDRVDIGVFVNNGKHFSAPAIISFMFLGNQKRIYDPMGKIISIDYQDPTYTKRYVDQKLFYAKDWRDDYQYDRKGNLVGWKRTRADKTEHFTRHGAKIVEMDSENRAKRAQMVRYRVENRYSKLHLVQHATKKFVSYQYEGKSDRLGRIVSRR